MKAIKVYISLFILLSINGLSQTVFTKLNPDNILVGDTASLQIEITVDNKTKVELPQIKDSLNQFIEVLNQKRDTLKLGENITYRCNFTLTSFEQGDFLVNSLPIKINGKIVQSDARELSVADLKVDTISQKMFPIKPIIPENLTWWDRNQKLVWFIIGGIMVALLLLFVIWYFYKRLKSDKYINSPLVPPYDEAMQNLKKLDKKNYIQNGDYKAFYSDLSFILRRYFSRRFDFPAQALLSSDLSEFMKSKQQISSEDAEELQRFLTDSDGVKYAKQQIEDFKHTEYRNWVEEIVQKTRPVEVENKPN
ncbi:hypothetical protein KRX57_02230 [Weeksellaceae bacterium TAE3-ERU29]|nr:hypothetical protein [Weeksellaceae bacterium TAE3-ERU29]